MIYFKYSKNVYWEGELKMNETLEIKKSRKSNIKKSQEINTDIKVNKKTFFSTVKANKELLLLTVPGTIWFLIFAYLSGSLLFFT